MQNNKAFLINYTPIFGMLFIFITLLTIERDSYYIILSLFYVWVYVWGLFNLTYVLAFSSFILGLFVDSIYNLGLGTFSFLLLTNIYLINLQSKFIKNNDFIKSISFFGINTLATLLFLQIVNFIIPINFPLSFLFILISFIIFIIMFVIIQLYINLFDNSHEE